MNDLALISLSKAEIALSECKTAMEAKQIADVAEAARIYLERTNASTQTVNHATEIRLLAERQMGAFLKTMPKSSGKDFKGNATVSSPKERVPDSPPTLAEIGITSNQSFRAQKLADIPEQEFKERIAVAKIDGKLSTAKILSFGEKPDAACRFSMPDQGMFLARGAIAQLERISLKDSERTNAIRHVRNWCNKQLKSK